MNKLLILLTLSLILSVSLFAQNVPNGGFESWTNGNPNNWYADNVPPVAVPITQATARTGSFSVKGTVVNTIGGLLAPLLESDINSQGFPVTQRFKTFTGYYQFNPVQGDKFTINCIMFKGGTTIGAGFLEISAAASAWTQVNIDFVYATSDIPDRCLIQIVISGPTGSDYHLGSYFMLDDLNLTGTATSISNESLIPANFSLEQNYPNPFNPTTKIQYSLPENSFVSLKVYNTIGMEVASLVNEVVPAGIHEVLFNAALLNSGVYFYTLKTGNFTQTRKMILMK